MAHPLLLANAQSLFGRACSPKGLEKGPLISPSLAPVLPSRATVEDGGGEGVEKGGDDSFSPSERDVKLYLIPKYLIAHSSIYVERGKKK